MQIDILILYYNLCSEKKQPQKTEKLLIFFLYMFKTFFFEKYLLLLNINIIDNLII